MAHDLVGFGIWRRGMTLLAGFLGWVCIEWLVHCAFGFKHEHTYDVASQSLA
jgi:hypothetical protein